ncbi:MAG: hypothetical protein K6C95_05720 [Lachnospiraceae bacterium]|nr:hypothetical protein [Lachnospiraceae bacterium]
MKTTKICKKTISAILISTLALSGCSVPAPAERSELYVNEDAATASEKTSKDSNNAATDATIVAPEEILVPDLATTGHTDAEKTSTATESGTPVTRNSAAAASGATDKAEENTVAETAPPETEESAGDAAPAEKKDDRIDIVFIGDSQFENERGTWSAISEVVREVVGPDECEVYNLGIGGSSASVDTYERGMSPSNWTSPSLLGMAHLIHGDMSPDFLAATHPRVVEIFNNIDISSIDYIVMDYGVNDYLDASEIYDQNTDEQYNDFADLGPAYSYSLDLLTEACPNATLVVCTPCYAQFYGRDGAYLGDGYSLSNGIGTLAEYVYHIENVVSLGNYSNVLYLNMFDGSRIDLDAYTAASYLMDGIHLTTAGRRAYGTAVGKAINRHRGADEEEYRVIKIDEFS